MDDENYIVPKFFQENLSQECKELISTLPKENCWFNINEIRQYDGFWIPPNILQGILSCHKHFQALDTDVLLVTFPKSGTTWLKAWTFALLNRKSYTNFHKHHPLLTTNPHDLVPFLEIDLYFDKDFVPALDSLSSPRLFCTHMPYASLPKSVKESRCKVIYLCRDPKDNFVSLWHFANKTRPKSREPISLKEGFEMFCSGVSPYGPFWDHILGYWKESLERSGKILFLRFEEMKMQPICCLKKIAQFLGCPFSEEEESAGMVNNILNLCSFENLSNLDVNKTGKTGKTGLNNKNFFRRGQVGDSENLLTSDMVEGLNIITKEKFTEHGLRF